MNVSIGTIRREDVASAMALALGRSERHFAPYRYWLMTHVLPDAAARALVDLPVDPPPEAVFNGRRETNNATRFYFNAEGQQRFSIARAIAEAFQSQPVVTAIERECGTDLSGTSLRIEYCRDVDGFWLEPHTDIGVKRFTMSVYLAEGEGAADLGTDIYDDKREMVACAPSPFNSAMVFIPGRNTFHGFRPRKIVGVRRSIIVNYVTAEWRAREELAYPETPVR